MWEFFGQTIEAALRHSEDILIHLNPHPQPPTQPPVLTCSWLKAAPKMHGTQANTLNSRFVASIKLLRMHDMCNCAIWLDYVCVCYMYVSVSTTAIETIFERYHHNSYAYLQVENCTMCVRVCVGRHYGICHLLLSTCWTSVWPEYGAATACEPKCLTGD